MVVPNYSSREDYDRMAALGVTSYGQMTAGSFMYIGPQGIVHGTTITLLNAGRRYLGSRGRGPGRQGVRHLGARRHERRAGQGGGDRGRGGRDRRDQPQGAVTSVTSRAGCTRSRPTWTSADADGQEPRRRKEAAVARLPRATSSTCGSGWPRRRFPRSSWAATRLRCTSPSAGGYYPVGLSFEEVATR